MSTDDRERQDDPETSSMPKYVLDDRRHIDYLNWDIEQIRRATGDTETAKPIEMNEVGFSWQMPISHSTTELREFCYGDSNGRREANVYLQMLKNAYSNWRRYASEYAEYQERVQALGNGRQADLVISLKGAELIISPEFFASREILLLKKPSILCSFSQLSLDGFKHNLEYIEWKDQEYKAKTDHDRRIKIALQALAFENWECRHIKS